MAVNPFKPSGNVARQLRLLAERDRARVAEQKARKAVASRAPHAPKGSAAGHPPAAGDTPAV